MTEGLAIPPETPCANCAGPIGASPWRMLDGRVYHRDCEAHEVEPTPRNRGEGLGEHAEQAARRVLNPGQETLDG